MTDLRRLSRESGTDFRCPSSDGIGTRTTIHNPPFRIPLILSDVSSRGPIRLTAPREREREIIPRLSRRPGRRRRSISKRERSEHAPALIRERARPFADYLIG